MGYKILKTGYDNLMLAYYVNYEDKEANRYTEYFDTISDRNAFIKSIQ
jgi:hypothetical protein